MFRRNDNPNENTAEMRAIRDTATRESHPYNDPRANYPTADEYRRVRAEGEARSQRPAAA